MRIVSLLPAATEIVCMLGLADYLVGVSHECAWPSEVKAKPKVMGGVLPIGQMTQAEIDAEVTRRLHAGEPIYEVDPDALARAAPDLVLTQELCAVCAATPGDLRAVLETLPQRPEVLELTPRSLADILGNIAEIGAATGHSDAASRLLASLEARIAAVRDRAAQAERRPRVFCMEWLDPPYCSGHWVPEMVELCGGVDVLSRKGSDSVRVPWEAVLDWAPEVLIVMPCGFDLDRVVREAEMLPRLPGWRDLPAVKAGRVHAADANAYFARPGPRVVDGLELLAHLLHPELFDWTEDPHAFTLLLTKTCPSCKVDFQCRLEPGCWCEALALPVGAADALSACYADCLCPDCLEGSSRQPDIHRSASCDPG